jgi:hypothetical protein
VPVRQSQGRDDLEFTERLDIFSLDVLGVAAIGIRQNRSLPGRWATVVKRYTTTSTRVERRTGLVVDPLRASRLDQCVDGP